MFKRKRKKDYTKVILIILLVFIGASLYNFWCLHNMVGKLDHAMYHVFQYLEYLADSLPKETLI